MNCFSLNLTTSPFSYPQNWLGNSYNSGQVPVVVSLFKPVLSSRNLCTGLGRYQDLAEICRHRPLCCCFEQKPRFCFLVLTSILHIAEEQ